MNRTTRLLAGIVLNTAAVVGAVTILVVLACLLMGVRPAIVISGSMEPTIPTGSMTFSRAVDVEDVQVGDIVTVPRTMGKGLITHRVMSIDPLPDGASLVLRGDANATDDPVPYAVRTVGKVVFHVPWLGVLAGAIRTPLGLAVVVLLLATVIIGGIRRRHGHQKVSGRNGGNVRTGDGAG